jgi:hypothetical protein
MFLELARPVTLLASILSLLAVLNTAFLGSEADFQQRIYDSVGMLLLAAGFSLTSGLVFARRGEGSQKGRLQPSHEMRITDTFPMLVFFWTTGVMVVVFLLAWYIETHCIFYRDVHH